MNEQPIFSNDASNRGSQDGAGAADHDQPFAGFRSYQFSALQLARLLQLRVSCSKRAWGPLGSRSRGPWLREGVMDVSLLAIVSVCLLGLLTIH